MIDIYLNGINVVGNDDQLSTVGLDELGDMVDSRNDGLGALDGVKSLTLGLSLSQLGQTLLLLQGSLGPVLVQQFEEGDSWIVY